MRKDWLATNAIKKKEPKCTHTECDNKLSDLVSIPVRTLWQFTWRHTIEPQASITQISFSTYVEKFASHYNYYGITYLARCEPSHTHPLSRSTWNSIRLQLSCCQLNFHFLQFPASCVATNINEFLFTCFHMTKKKSDKAFKQFKVVHATMNYVECVDDAQHLHTCTRLVPNLSSNKSA